MREDINGPVYKDVKKYKLFKKIEKISLFTLLLVVTAILLIASIMSLFESIAHDNVYLLIFVYIQIMGIPMLSYGWFLLFRLCAKYKFSQMGMIVRYPLGFSQYCSWDEFQQVCICYSDYATRGMTRATSVICCVKNGEEKNGYGRWKTENPFHYKSVITIDYTDEMFEQIKEKYPRHIPDLRRTPAYKLKV